MNLEQRLAQAEREAQAEFAEARSLLVEGSGATRVVRAIERRPRLFVLLALPAGYATGRVLRGRVARTAVQGRRLMTSAVVHGAGIMQLVRSLLP